MTNSYRRLPFIAATLWLLLGCLNSASASVFDQLLGQKDDGPLDVEQAYQFEAIETAPGQFQLFWTIEEGYYLYQDKIKFTLPEGVRITNSVYAQAELKDDPLFGEVKVYHGQAEVLLSLLAEQAQSDVPISVEYQGCWEGGICYPPVTKTFTANIIPNQAAEAEANIEPAADAAKWERGLSLTDQNQVTQFLNEASWSLILLLFFVAGLGLSLTPCVFPMIPILASVIAGQQQQSARQGFWLSLVYVLAMAVTYTLAGVLAGLFGSNIQAAFQTPWIITLFSLLFVLFAGAMFGFYRLEMPHTLQNKLNLMCRHQQGGQFVGVAVMGFLSALIVGPCVAAPLAGALIFIGQTGDPWLGGGALFSMSLGMGVPLILVGTSAAKFLPQAGNWMNTVKHGFGVIMLLMAVWMLDRIVPTQLTLLLVGMILIVTAVFMSATDRLKRTASAAQRLGKGLGIILLVYGLSLLIGAAAGSQSLLYPLKGLVSGVSAQKADQNFMQRFVKIRSEEALAPILENAREQRMPVMLDLYADWCVSCKELEVLTFADNAVQDRLAEFVLVKVDLTKNDDAAKAFYRRYAVVGPPALIFYNQQGEELPNKLVVGVPSAAAFVQHLADI